MPLFIFFLGYKELFLLSRQKFHSIPSGLGVWEDLKSKDS